MGELKFAKQVLQTVACCILKDFAEYYVDKDGKSCHLYIGA